MPETPNGLPYPDGDSEPRVAYWLQQLAEALDAYAGDTGWVPLTLASGFESYSETYTVKIRRIGKVAFMRGLVHATSGDMPTSETLVATLPAGFAPSQHHLWFTSASGSTPGGRGRVEADGDLRFQCPSGTSYVSCSTSWSVD